MLTIGPDQPLSISAIQVAAAVILNASGECLLALRPEHKHQGGLWEFPGGKIESGETARQALDREILEELDLTICKAEPLLVTTHHYPEIEVTLDVWLVTQFSGQPCGLEGQKLQWFTFTALQDLEFPAANYPIITALGLILSSR